MRISLLSFELEVSELPVEDFSLGSFSSRAAKMRLVAVRPLVNGTRLLPHFTFDAFEVLANGTATGSVMAFTCSCGEPDCVGVYDDCYFGQADRVFCWRFPDEPFEAHRDALRIAPGEPLELTFSETQYRTALRGLETRLLGLEQQADTPLVLAPDSSPVSTGLSQRLAARRQQIQEDIKQLEARLATFGPLLREELVATLPQGLKVRIPAWTVPLAAAHVIVSPVLDDEAKSSAIQARLVNELLPPMFSDRSVLIKTARNLGLEILAEWMSLEFDDADGVTTYPDVSALVEPFQTAPLRIEVRTV